MAGLLAAAGQRFPSASRTTAIHSLKSAGRRCFITKPLGRPLEGLRTWSLSTLLQIRKRNRHLFDRVAAPGKGEAASQGEPHVPVLIEQVLESFRDTKLGTYVDGTLGAAGHAAAIALEHEELHTLIGIDQDPSALTLARRRLEGALSGAGRSVDLHFVHSNFSSIKKIVEGSGSCGVGGILLDLGMSSMQVDSAERGFSFMADGPLDMRMDPNAPLTAEEVVNTWSERQLGHIFKEYGEEKFWRLYANRICAARETSPLRTTLQLAGAIGQPIFRSKGSKQRKPIHPATRVFQALRIAVNDELGVAEKAIPDAIDCLASGGRLAVITFHSLEDRIVKKAFLSAAGQTPSNLTGMEARLYLEMNKPTAAVKLVTKKPLVALESELCLNARSRSAKLRVVEKL